MAITLAPELEERILHEVDGGGFSGPSELIARALDSLMIDQFVETHREQIRADVEQSLAEIARGEVFTEDQVRAKLKERRHMRMSAA